MYSKCTRCGSMEHSPYECPTIGMLNANSHLFDYLLAAVPSGNVIVVSGLPPEINSAYESQLTEMFQTCGKIVKKTFDFSAGRAGYS